MKNKNKVGDLCIMLCVLHVITAIGVLKSIENTWIVANNYALSSFTANLVIPFGIDTTIFQAIFIFFMFVAVKNEDSFIHIYGEGDEGKLRQLRKQMLPYKALFVLQIVGCIVLVILTKQINIVFLVESIFVLSIYGLIYYAKHIYYKSYLFDRYIDWMKTISDDEYPNSNQDTKIWRYKIWNDKRESVRKKDRGDYIMNSLVGIIGSFLFCTIFAGYINGSTLLVVWLLRSIAIFSEAIFSLFTTLEGVCTETYTITKGKANTTYYVMVVTDFYNKREIKITMQEQLFIDYTDGVRVVHGILSKRVISINGVRVSIK